MKRFRHILFSALFVLAGCFHSGDGDTSIVTTDVSDEVQEVRTRGIVLEKPVEWDILTREDSPDKLPPGVILLFSSVEPWGAGDMFATVSVAREAVPSGTSARRYTGAASKKTKDSIVQYEEIENANMKIGDHNAKYIRFSGKSSLEEPTLEWQHLFLATEDMGYVVSSATPPDASNAQKDLLKQIVTSFNLEE